MDIKTYKRRLRAIMHTRIHAHKQADEIYYSSISKLADHAKEAGLRHAEMAPVAQSELVRMYEKLDVPQVMDGSNG